MRAVLSSTAYAAGRFALAHQLVRCLTRASLPFAPIPPQRCGYHRMPAHGHHQGAYGAVGCSLAAGVPREAQVSQCAPPLFSHPQVRLQTQTGCHTGRYMGPVECARTILRLEGVKAFYKGMVRPDTRLRDLAVLCAVLPPARHTF